MRLRYSDESMIHFKKSDQYMNIDKINFRNTEDIINGVFEINEDAEIKPTLKQEIKEDPSPDKSEIVRYEADAELWIEDHTGVKRKPFTVMIREVKEILKNKIVILHNLA